MSEKESNLVLRPDPSDPARNGVADVFGHMRARVDRGDFKDGIPEREGKGKTSKASAKESSEFSDDESELEDGESAEGDADSFKDGKKVPEETDVDDDDDEESDDEDSEEEEEDESEEEDEEDEEEGDEEDDEEESEEEDEGEEDDTDYKAKAPIVATLPDGKKVTLPPDATLLINVDGKKQAVNVHKAVAEYTGKLLVDREVNKAQQAERNFNAKVAQVKKLEDGYKEVDKVFTEALEKMSKGGGLEAWHDLVMLSGQYKSPIDWEVKFLSELIPLANEIAGMTVDEQNAFINSRQIAYYKRKEKEDEDKKKENPENSALGQEIRSLKEVHRISDEEWNHASSILRKVRDEGRLSDYGIERVTPQVAVELILTNRAETQADRVMSDEPKLQKRLGDKKYAEVRKIVARAARKLEPSDDDLREVLAEALGGLGKDADSEDAKRLGKRFAAARPSKQQGSKPKKKKQYRTFDQLRADLGGME